MRFSATTLLALTASASAAVLPRSQYGSWDVVLEEKSSGEQYMDATFTSDAYPNGLRSACISNPTATPAYFRCNRAAITYSYDGTTLKMQQSIELPNTQTVFGEVALELTPSPYEDLDMKQGRVTVPVNKAIA
ncbi:hypothetical protein GQ44DRAFT_709239 [Phaeosphaeriaceae sp. PMI808]|nr:hypothetical protein GQ44DRAFT_709239 [Phaeosphaeriaceae sp. PMI808]